ncbi:hypothetical protein Y032_0043g758 [Ancylostoma ceylanicum]|nr:hypothetical protein Y032_0043g758 [Ancylostoma ceylanicum]
MLLQVLCIFLLLNAFTQDVVAQACSDKMPQQECEKQKAKGNCESPYTEAMMRMTCRKTCGFCPPERQGTSGCHCGTTKFSAYAICSCWSKFLKLTSIDRARLALSYIRRGLPVAHTLWFYRDPDHPSHPSLRGR